MKDKELVQQMTIPQRLERVQQKIIEHNILSMHADNFNQQGQLEEVPIDLIVAEDIIDAIEECEKEYPSSYTAYHIKFVEKVRSRVWSRGSPFQEFYFDLAQHIFWKYRKMGKTEKECNDLCFKLLDPDEVWKLFDFNVSKFSKPNDHKFKQPFPVTSIS